MENTFTSKEIDTLVDALEAWENKDFGGALMDLLMRAMFIPKDAPQELKDEVLANEKAEKDKMEREKQQRKEISVLLKAKLIQMKHEQGVAALSTVGNNK